MFLTRQIRNTNPHIDEDKLLTEEEKDANDENDHKAENEIANSSKNIYINKSDRDTDNIPEPKENHN